MAVVMKKNTRIIAAMLTVGVLSNSALAAGQSTKIEQKDQPFVLKLGATRLIYAAGSGGATLMASNVQDYPMLVKSEVFREDKKTPASFIVTPPLFRLDAQQQSRLRIVSTGGDDLVKDKETLQWVCVTGIPPKADDSWAQHDGAEVVKPSHATINVQVKMSSCIKLFVRPGSVKGTPTDVASSLTWQRQGDKLKVTNPTPFYMNLTSVVVGGKKIATLDYVPPSGSRELNLPAGASGPVEWKIITDYGGESRTYTSTLQ